MNDIKHVAATYLKENSDSSGSTLLPAQLAWPAAGVPMSTKRARCSLPDEIQHEMRRGRLAGWSMYATRLRQYASSAARRGLAFELSMEQFRRLIDGPCHYCGGRMTIGIDRVVNTVGYINTNCVSCCSRCNFMKGDLLYQEFIQHCAAIAECQRSKQH